MKTFIKIFSGISVIAFFCITSFIHAQTVSIVKGKVTDKETGNPLEAASVYFAQTTIGTWANKSGDFIFTVAKPGNYELVVSMIGYEPQKLNIFIEKASVKNYQFKLAAKVINIAPINVIAENQGVWKENLKIFKNKFLGTIASADEYDLQNIEYINFSRDSSLLKASTSKPIIIVNNYLGYRIEVELVSFDFNFAKGTYHYTYYPRFFELTPPNSIQMKEWIKNRDKYYYGSPAHFIWALKNNIVNEEDFTALKGYDEVVDWSSFKKEFSDVKEYYYNLKGIHRIIYKKWDVSDINMKVPFFTIDDNGVPDVYLPFSVGGKWAAYGMANLLPKDYLPEKLKK